MFLNKIQCTDKDLELAFEENFLISEGEKIKNPTELDMERAEENGKEKLDEKEPEVMEDELGIDRGSIKTCCKLKLDYATRKGIPEFDGYDDIYITHDGTQFKTVGMKNGEMEYIDGIESSRSVTEPILDVKNDGKVEEAQVNGLMRFKQSRDNGINFGLAVKIGQYGTMEVKKISRDPTTKDLNDTSQYMGTPIAVEGQYPIQTQVAEISDPTKNIDVSHEIESYDKRKEMGDKEITAEEISDYNQERTDEETQHQEQKDQMSSKRAKGGKSIHDGYENGREYRGQNSTD